MVAKARPLRADARRNRELVLETARAAFETDGISVPIDDIARRAGLGIGTVYRHFPTKQHLVAAVVCDRLDRLAERVEALTRADDAGAAFVEFLELLADELARKRAFREAISSEDLQAATATRRARFKAAIGKLLRRAQTDGAIRSDVTIEDVVALLQATVPTPDRPRPATARLLSIVRDGLRPS